jgi:succinate dehydrogenase/fumarate reductase-like Fe-S protein
MGRYDSAIGHNAHMLLLDKNLRKQRIKEAKRLKKVYDKQGVTECYCSQNSSSECPLHLEAYIRSLEWNSNAGVSNNRSRKYRKSK